MAGGISEPFQGSWAYLEPHGITLGGSSISRGMGGLKKEFFFSDFVLYPLQNFQEVNLGKVLFLFQPPKIRLILLCGG